MIDSKHRKEEILIKLLNLEKVSYQTLSQEYFVSKSSIAKDFEYIRELIKPYDLYLVFNQRGTYIEASETKIQNFIKNLIEEKPGYFEEKFIKKDQLNAIHNNLIYFLEEKELPIYLDTVRKISISFAVLFSRKNKGRYIEELNNSIDVVEMFNFQNIPLIYELIYYIGSKLDYSLSKEDVYYIALFLLGNRMSDFFTNIDVPDGLINQVKDLIQQISIGLSNKDMIDNKLLRDLSVHLMYMVLRRSINISMHSTLINDIKNKYPVLYQLTSLWLTNFCDYYKTKLTDAEIMYVVIHIQAAIERNKNKKRILVVCPSGYGFGSFISAKVKSSLPSDVFVEVASELNYKELLTEKIAYIVSTRELDQKKLPSVVISPLVQTEDMKKIFDLYLRFIYQEKDYISPKTTKQNLPHYIYHLDLQNKEDIIKALIQKVNNLDDCSKPLFIDSIFNREHMQSTYLGNGIALPHGDPKFINQTMVLIAVLEKPILWDGTNIVDTIILLLVKKGESYLLEEFMNELVEEVNNKALFLEKMKKRR
ncbi:transcription antiterminator [Bulleidia sp. zg-1006]|uniref:BglG family transcription antiterminator n=1 Tax=Bulleidia sp. zg-1006 TaxID=2806552 RepID=UPI001939D182|nr:PTS sugar transporter subunit IIA [Bulleidia sp. zg-1006]QRG86969.1 PTS sugar transporter subunit IIA [Bulleidia sp. zg-1006]